MHDKVTISQHRLRNISYHIRFHTKSKLNRKRMLVSPTWELPASATDRDININFVYIFIDRVARASADSRARMSAGAVVILVQ